METNKKQILGQKIFKITLIIAVIVFLCCFILSLSLPKETDEDVSFAAKINYGALFYVFTIVIPSGAFIREIFSFVYDKKKIKLKIILSSVLVIIGSVVFVIFKEAKIWQYMDIIAILLLTYTLTPTTENRKDK